MITNIFINSMITKYLGVENIQWLTVDYIIYIFIQLFNHFFYPYLIIYYIYLFIYRGVNQKSKLLHNLKS